MIVNGTVVSAEIDVEVNKKDGGSYQGARLTFRDTTGKIQEQAFHNNAFKFNAALKTSLINLKAGDTIAIEKEKNKNDFWEVKSITKTAAPVAGQAAPSPTPSASPKSTYETAEERAKKQVYIVRQSSLSAAIAFSKSKTIDDVITTAKHFEAYVFDTNTTPETDEFNGDEGEVY